MSNKTAPQQLFSVSDEQEATLVKEWYWHTLYFLTKKESETAKKYITPQYDVHCTTLPCSSNEYEVSFFTDYEFDDVFRTHLITNMGVSPTATLFNESTDDMLDRESSQLLPGESEPDVTVLQVAMAFVLTALLLPFAYAFFLAYMPKVLLEHFTREKWFAGHYLWKE